MPVPDGYTLIPAPTPGPPPGYTLDAKASMAPNQTNPAADTTGGQALGAPQTSPPPGAKYKAFNPPVKAAAKPDNPAIEAPDIATDFGNQNPKPQAVTPSESRVSQWDAPSVDPARLQTLSRFNFGVGSKPLVEELRGVVWDADRKHMREEFLWRDPGGNIRDDRGNKLDPDLVDRRALGSRAGSSILQRMEIHDPGAPFGHSNAIFNTMTNEWARPKGDDRPLPEVVGRYYGSEGENIIALANARAYTALEEKRAAASQALNARYQHDKEYWIQQRSKLNTFNQPMITDQQLRDNLKRIDDQYFGPNGYKAQEDAGFNRAQKAIEKDPISGIRNPVVTSLIGQTPATQPPPAVNTPGATPQAQGATTTQGLLDYLK